MVKLVGCWGFQQCRMQEIIRSELDTKSCHIIFRICILFCSVKSGIMIHTITLNGYILKEIKLNSFFFWNGCKNIILFFVNLMLPYIMI